MWLSFFPLRCNKKTKFCHLKGASFVCDLKSMLSSFIGTTSGGFQNQGLRRNEISNCSKLLYCKHPGAKQYKHILLEKRQIIEYVIECHLVRYSGDDWLIFNSLFQLCLIYSTPAHQIERDVKMNCKNTKEPCSGCNETLNRDSYGSYFSGNYFCFFPTTYVYQGCSGIL